MGTVASTTSIRFYMKWPSFNGDEQLPVVVIFEFGDPVPDIICGYVGGTMKTGEKIYGAQSVCEDCEFRFLCLTNSPEEIGDII